MRLRKALLLLEKQKFKRQQKEELEHFILNVMTNRSLTKFLKQIEMEDEEDITISRQDAKVIMDNLKRIREFIISLPREDE